MGFLLKIVEGPNKGAEIALPEGVAVTLGKGDDCDIVLIDPTLPGEPATFEASADGVKLDGRPFEPYNVRTLGATSFAVGPAGVPWGELKWPEPEPKEGESSEEGEKKSEPAPAAPPPAPAEPAKPTEESASEEKKSRGIFGWIGCLVVVVVLLFVLALVAFLFMRRTNRNGQEMWEWTTNVVTGVCERRLVDPDKAAQEVHVRTIADVIEHYGLSETNRAGRTVLVGDFETRAERLAATAEAYELQPGIELDFVDAESLRTAAEDTLGLIGEKGLRVDAVTNRVVALSGRVLNIKRTLKAFVDDLPKLRNVDVANVKIGAALPDENTDGDSNSAGDAVAQGPMLTSRPTAKAAAPSLPVCGILTTPYPCLVLKSGARVMEGASIGAGVVLKIEADSVTLTNSMGRFTWKP